jgi:hypothetical protein
VEDEWLLLILEGDGMSKRKCTKIYLEGGTSDTDHKFLDIAPTMKNITHNGKRYFRCPRSWAQDPADGEWAVMYLWDGWGDWKLKQIQDRKAVSP